ncbi:MAG: rhodanese-like domain-containing protein [Bacteroidota bacterium]|nr:rhodanese-like domain-containing protein [Bacteroidota bacterium]
MSNYAKLLKNYAVLLLILPLLVFTQACSDDDDDPITPAPVESELLVAELEGPNGNYMNTDCPSIVTAQAVYENVSGANTWYIMDIRSAADYAKGHIPGAVNVTRADLLTHAAANNFASKERVVIICYSGQSAAWSTAILRMSGYNNVSSMKYGMSSWHPDFDSISSKTGSDYQTQFVKDAAPAKPAAGDLPAINTGKTTGAEILAARVAAVHAEDYGAAATSAAAVFAAPDQFFILNYWIMGDYTGIGHIPGAYQYTPKADLASDAFLKTLPTDKTIAVYCYTGQTSANVAAILRVLGYDAKSLSFGTQGMIWQDMVAAGKTAFDASKDCMGFAYEK